MEDRCASVYLDAESPNLWSSAGQEFWPVGSESRWRHWRLACRSKCNRHNVELLNTTWALGVAEGLLRALIHQSRWWMLRRGRSCAVCKVMEELYESQYPSGSKSIVCCLLDSNEVRFSRVAVLSYTWPMSFRQFPNFSTSSLLAGRNNSTIR